MLFSIFPVAIITLAIRPFVETLTMLPVIEIEAGIGAAIGPVVGTVTVHFGFDPLAVVGATIWP